MAVGNWCGSSCKLVIIEIDILVRTVEGERRVDWEMQDMAQGAC